MKKRRFNVCSRTLIKPVYDGIEKNNKNISQFGFGSTKKISYTTKTSSTNNDGGGGDDDDDNNNNGKCRKKN